MSKYKFVLWIAVLLWMTLIFNLSSQVAEQSNELSKGVTKIIVEVVNKVAPDAKLDIKSFNHIVRKNAHFFSYLALGILVLAAIRISGIKGFKSAVFAFLICVFYAVTDETHQLFVPGRGAQIKDIVIDSTGVAVGVFIYWIIHRLFKSRKKFKN